MNSSKKRLIGGAFVLSISGAVLLTAGPAAVATPQARTITTLECKITEDDTFKVMEDDYPDADDDLGTITIQPGVTSYGINKDDAIYNVLVS